MVWCEEHKTYEKAAAWQNGTLKTDAGCQITGLFGENISWMENGELPMRWRVSYQEKSRVVFLCMDIAKIVWSSTLDHATGEIISIPRISDYRTEGLSIHMGSEEMVPERNCRDIPLCVADAAIGYMMDAAEIFFGERPILPQSLESDYFTKGRTRLTAFLHFPFNMNLWLLKVYFSDGKLCKDIFVRAARDPFQRLCHELKLCPTDELRQDYEKEPYALIITSILRCLGIQTYDLVRPFFAFTSLAGDEISDGCKKILGIYNYQRLHENVFPADIFSDDDAVRTMLHSRQGNFGEWIPLMWYCQWLLSQKGEKHLADHLLALNQKWESRFIRFMRIFYNNFPDIPKELRQQIREEGPKLELHNEMIRSINKKKLGLPDFTYSEKQRGYACMIDGYEFRLIRTSEEFHSIMVRLKCIGVSSAFPSLNDDGILRIGVFRKGRALACLILHGILKAIIGHAGGGIYQHLLYRSGLRIAILHWLKWTGLHERYGPYYESDYEFLDQEVHAEPLPPETESNLYALLNLPEDEIQSGYYLQLQRALHEARILYHETTRQEESEDELSHLMQVFPYGVRIFKAALSGNKEAQRALALCYGKYTYDALLPHDKKRFEYWNTKCHDNE